jgi:hypothetical protein
VPRLAIPREYERGIVVIKTFSDADVDRVVQFLKSADARLDRAELTSKLSSLLESLSKEDVAKFAETLTSLYFLRAHSDVSVEQFVDDLTDAVRESDNKDILTLDSAELAQLKKRFSLLLTIRALYTRSKALGLRTDFANIFWDAKVITDIRPIWDGDVTQVPDGIVITNTLNLEYHHVGGHGEIYIAIDNEDIELLIAVLKRAQDKTVTLSKSEKPKWMEILED